MLAEEAALPKLQTTTLVKQAGVRLEHQFDTALADDDDNLFFWHEPDAVAV